MLMSAGIKLPKCLAVHGWWTKDGEKMPTKSLGNVVNPLDEIEKYIGCFCRLLKEKLLLDKMLIILTKL